ncbi:MAG TPA: hypothetical protein DCZ72_14090, partial [Armatimonadetes bacterium]|nr:hypothetical protein [Armatimonadota bacterium]
MILMDRSMTTWRALATLYLLSLLAGRAPAAEPPPWLAGLDAGGTLQVLCLGDSISDGWQMTRPEADAYPALLQEMLAARWPAAQVEVVADGQPGGDSTGGLWRLEAHLEAIRPQVVVLQFGGNDKGTGDGLLNLPRYEANLRDLVAMCRAAGARPVLCAPPMHELVLGMPFPTAAARIAAELDVPLANFDRALKQNLVDSRGVFPFGIHPLEYGHARLADVVYPAVREAMGAPLAARLTFEPCNPAAAAAPAPVSLDVRLDNLTPTPVAGRAWVEVAAAGAETALDVAADGAWQGAVEVPLPPPAADARSREFPLRLHADLGSERLLERAVLAEVPLLSSGYGGALAASNLTGQATTWGGVADLAAQVTLTNDANRLTVTVTVQDDVVVPADGPPRGDGIELYLDLRPDGQRGAPPWSDQCLALMVGLGADGAATVT